jgi:hypothetical protein
MDQLPTMTANVDRFFASKPLISHIKGKSFFGQIDGPLMIAFGHDLSNGYGIGPNLPQPFACCCWFVCCCQAPSGHLTNVIKSCFNNSIHPVKGSGY